MPLFWAAEGKERYCMQRMLNPARVRMVRWLIAVAIVAIPALSAVPVGAGSSPHDTFRLTLQNHTGFLLSNPVIIAAPHGWQPFELGPTGIERDRRSCRDGHGAATGRQSVG